ncbi:Transposon gamma-delta resolvase [Paenibacillus polymyxa]|uniref:recombinase family protein n=1 Tax=Paenibacillus polymyxa TaxID=1406 RepID=UPI000AB2E9F0|nr:recombinase family protein [Paenibacillus polymyxa]VUG05272.1 Transposon gamma-delta resolvase [Paenibacillus polymyxa]
MNAYITAIYPRVSTGMQASEGTSLEGQVEICCNKARKLGIQENTLQVYQEEGFTGEDIDRPALNRLMQDIKLGKIKSLIVTHPDRLTRDLTDKLIICRELEKHDVELIFVDTEYKNTPEGQLFFNMMSSIAQYELSLIKKRTVRGRLRAVEKDKKIMPMRVAPYGYDLVDGQLIINEEEAKFVQFIYHWYVHDSKTMKQIGENLYLMGAVPKRAESKQWSASSIGRVLTSEIYIGKYYYNRRSTKKIKGEKTATGKAKKTYTIRNKEEWISVDVPPLIDLGTFELAQKKKRTNFTRTGRNVKHHYLLRSLIKCSHCGRVWEATSYPGKAKNGEKKSYPIYRCANKYPKRYGEGVEKCDIPVIRTEILDEYIWGIIVNVLNNPEHLKNDLSKKDSHATDELMNLKNIFEKQIEEKEKEREKIKFMFRKGVIEEDELETDMTTLNKEVKRIQGELGRLEEKISLLNRQSMSEDVIKVMVSKYQEVLNNELAPEIKRRIVENLIDEIIIRYDHEKKQFNLSFYGFLNRMVDGFSKDNYFVSGTQREKIR